MLYLVRLGILSRKASIILASIIILLLDVEVNLVFRNDNCVSFSAFEATLFQRLIIDGVLSGISVVYWGSRSSNVF